MYDINFTEKDHAFQSAKVYYREQIMNTIVKRIIKDNVYEAVKELGEEIALWGFFVTYLEQKGVFE